MNNTVSYCEQLSFKNIAIRVLKGYFEKEILVFIGFKRWKGDLYYFVFYYYFSQTLQFFS